MKRPQLSLCMIIRNEQEMLPEFLASVAGLWDEFIAVDTGSTDNSVGLLTTAGARIIHHQWQDNFSEARNVSLTAATGTWILFLDADERVSPQLYAQIKNLLDDTSAGAATVVMRNELPGGHLREASLLRMFRNDSSIRFAHQIHEDVSASVHTYLEQTGLEMFHLPGVVKHLGYVREFAAARNKKERDLKLLTISVEQDPTDLYCWFKILEQARFWEDIPLWQQTATSALAQFELTDQQLLRKLPYAGELVALIGKGLNTPPAETLDWLLVQEDKICPSAPFYLFKGRLLEDMRQFDAAVHAYESCRTDRFTTSAQLTTVRPLMGLSRIAAAKGEIVEAQRLAMAAVRKAPSDPEALLAAVTFIRITGQEKALAEFVDRYIDQHQDLQVLYHSLGLMYLNAGLTKQAILHVQQATGKPPQGPEAITLAQAQLASGDVEAALATLEPLVETLPEAALGYLACSVILNRDVDLQVDLDQQKADQVLQNWLRVLWRSRQVELMSAFVDNAGSIGQIFTWLPEFLEDETKRLHDQSS